MLRVPRRNADCVNVQIPGNNCIHAGSPDVELIAIQEDTTALFALFHPLLLEGRYDCQMMDRGICAGSLHVLLPHL
jgi:hypothetical protein